MRTIVYIGNKLSAHGYSPTMIESLGPLLEAEYHVIYASERLSRLPRLCDMLATLWRCRRHADRVVIDTYSTAAFYYAWIVSQAARLLSLSYIPILHGGNLPDRLRRNPVLSRMMFTHARCNVAPSGYLGAAFERLKYPTAVIPNFIPIRDYEFKDRGTFGPRILWVRSFDRSYNPTLAIRALHELAATFPDASLCMVGPDKDGSLSACQELARDLGLAPRVAFPGRLPKPAWHRLARDYDIFLNTTNVDNTPVSVIEAMALGLPVVSTNVGGIPHLVTDAQTGLLVDPDDPRRAADAVRQIVRNPAFGRAIARNARRHAEQFSAENVLQQWRALLEA